MMSSGIHEKLLNNILDNNFTTLTSKRRQHLSLYVTQKYVGCHIKPNINIFGMQDTKNQMQKKKKRGLRKYQLKVFVCNPKVCWLSCETNI